MNHSCYPKGYRLALYIRYLRTYSLYIYRLALYIQAGSIYSVVKLGLPWWLSWYRIRLPHGRPGFHPWVGKTPWRRERLPTPVFWPGESHGLYSLWQQRVGHDGATFTFTLFLTTENFAFSFFCVW